MSQLEILRYTIELLSPLVLYQSHDEENLISSKDEIPGSMLWGAFAGLYKKDKNLNNPDFGTTQEDINFRSWFTEGNLIFKNAVPIKEDTSTQGKLNQFYKLPFYLQKKKNADEEQKELYNLLVEEPTDEQFSKKDFRGFLNYSDIDTIRIKKRINFHHERDREKGFSKKGLIFHYESIESGQMLGGYIIGNTESIQAFKEWLGKERFLFLGRSRSAQYGKVKLSILDKEFNQESIEKKNFQRDKEISITFLTDTILPSANGFSTCDIKEIANYLQEFHLTLCKDKPIFLQTTTIEGYNAKWKTRVPSETCIQAGSGFYIKGNQNTNWEKLVLSGIGLKTNQGFGDIRFQLYTDETYIYNEDKEENQKALDDKVPDSVRVLYKSLIEKKITSYIESKAAEHANKIYNKNRTKITNSMLARLEKIIHEYGTLKEKEESKEKKKLPDSFLRKIEKIKDDSHSLKETLSMNHLGKPEDFFVNKVKAAEKGEGLEQEKEMILKNIPEYEKDYKIFLLSYIRKKVKTTERLPLGESNGK